MRTNRPLHLGPRSVCGGVCAVRPPYVDVLVLSVLRPPDGGSVIMPKKLVLTKVVVAQFWANTDRTAKCWIWKGRLTTDGYGYAPGILASTRRAHRVAWLLWHKLVPIPKGLYVCHHCDTPSCVNPAHLFLGAGIDNV